MDWWIFYLLLSLGAIERFWIFVRAESTILAYFGVMPMFMLKLVPRGCGDIIPLIEEFLSGVFFPV